MIRAVHFATIALFSLTGSLPLYLYGAWIIIDAEVVTWAVLKRHLTVIAIGLTLTLVPIIGWMIPRFVQLMAPIYVFHAVIGLHAFALLAFALTGIVRILRAKVAHDLYADPAPSMPIEDLGPRMGHYRKRLRIGVFGYLILWLLAYVVGIIQYGQRYL